MTFVGFVGLTYAADVALGVSTSSLCVAPEGSGGPDFVHWSYVEDSDSRCCACSLGYCATAVEGAAAMYSKGMLSVWWLPPAVRYKYCGSACHSGCYGGVGCCVV